MTTLNSASDNPIKLNISTTGAKGPAGQNGTDGQGFAQVRYNIINNPMFRILKKRDAANVVNSNISFTRNTPASYIDIYDNLVFADSDDLRENSFGYRFDGQSENLFLNSLAPVNQDINLVSDDYTLTVLGPGTVSTTLGNATENNPLTFNDSGLKTFQVTGVVDAVQLESGVKSTSIIKTLSLPVARSADILTFETNNNLPDLTSNWSFLFYVDSIYDDFCVIDSQQLRVSKNSDGFWSIGANISTASAGNFIAITYDGLQTKIYSDGVLVDTLTNAYNKVDDGVVQIASRIDGSRPLVGSLLDIQFFNTELNEYEINLLKV